MSNETQRERPRPLFLLGLMIGGALMVQGARVLFDSSPTTAAWIGLVITIVALDLLNDGVVLPVISIIGRSVTRVVPSWLRAPMQVGLIISAPIAAVGLLPLLGTADVTGNPTIQPLNYSVTVPSAIGLVWAPVMVWALVRWRRAANSAPVGATSST